MGINGLNLNPGSCQQREVKSKLVPLDGQHTFWRAIPQKKGRGRKFESAKKHSPKNFTEDVDSVGGKFCLVFNLMVF